MLFPKEKERSHRFMLALRTALPLFSLAAILTFASISDYFQHIPTLLFILAIFILAISVYFIFYMIYRGFDEQITDPITHTFTRSKLVTILKEDIAKYDDYSIVLIRIENLHDINARYGTGAGDNVLQSVAREVGQFFLDKGFDKFPIGHFKGGDFLLGLKGNYSLVRPFVEMMIIKFDDFIIDDIEIKIRGAIVDKSLSSDTQALIERVFELYEADRDEDEDISESDQDDDLSLLALQEDVRYAMKNRKMSLMFQPIKADEKVVQASIKLQGKNENILHQKRFIPMVKRLGFEREYDEIIIEKILHIYKKKSHISFAFNISPSVLRNRRFFQRFKQMVEKEKVDYKGLIIILSEKEVYTNMRRYNELLQEYRELGVRFVLDNVGSLNASVEYLKRLEVDIIRFDKPYSRHIDSPVYAALLKAYKKISDDLGMKSWIKMVDTKEAKEYFEKMKIDYIQGNAISKIVTYDKLEDETF
jgi:EAL domain-containing protein (putative c-di-GMP-specific phosphodiesterase class I)